jgi:Domain of unknown function (DUF4345)
LAWLAVGLQGLTVPARLLAPVSIRLDGVDALNEARALYGGMHLALAALYLVGAFRPPWQRPLLWLWVLLVGSLVAGRLISVIVDGVPPGFARVLLGLEAAGVALGLAVLRWGLEPAAPAAEPE